MFLQCLGLAVACEMMSAIVAGPGVAATTTTNLPEIADRIPWHGDGVWLHGETHTHFLLSHKPGRDMMDAAAENDLDFIASTEHAEAAFKHRPAETIAVHRREHPNIIVLAGVQS